jgi:hypothetical protein
MPTARNARGTNFDPGHGFPDEDDYAPGDWKDTDDLLGPAIPSVTWPEIGAHVSGYVESTIVTPQTTPEGEVKKFANGDVMRQVVITLQTAESVNEDDDGQRRLFVKGAMVKAMREELRRARVMGIRPGGHLTVIYKADGEVKTKGYNPAKLFDVKYTPPTS